MDLNDVVPDVPADGRFVLTEPQRTRIECLKAARSSLEGRTLGGTVKPDVEELMRLARFIETGEVLDLNLTPAGDTKDDA